MCGTGSIVLELARSGIKIVAADINPCAVFVAQSRSGITHVDDASVDALINAEPKHGYLSKSTITNPTSFYTRNYIDGLVSKAWDMHKSEAPGHEIAMGAISAMLITCCGNLGQFRSNMEPYKVSDLKILLRRCIDWIQHDRHINLMAMTESTNEYHLPVISISDATRIKNIPRSDMIFYDPPVSKVMSKYNIINSVLFQKDYRLECKVPEINKYKDICKLLTYTTDTPVDKKYVNKRDIGCIISTACDKPLKLYEKLSHANIDTYDPRLASTEAEIQSVNDDFKLCQAWWATIRSGGVPPCPEVTEERCIQLGTDIMKIIGSHGRKLNLHEDGFSDFHQAIYHRLGERRDLITRASILCDDIQGSQVRLPKNLDVSRYLDKTVYLHDSKGYCHGIGRLSTRELVTEFTRFNTPRELDGTLDGQIIRQAKFKGNIDFDEVYKHVDILELKEHDIVKLHDNLHNYYNGSPPKGWTIDDVTNIHENLTVRMQEINIMHESIDALDSASPGKKSVTIKQVADFIDHLPDKIEIKGIRAISGHFAEQYAAARLDAIMGNNTLDVIDQSIGSLNPSLTDLAAPCSTNHTVGEPVGRYIPIYDAIFIKRPVLDAQDPVYFIDFSESRYVKPSKPRICEMTEDQLVESYGQKPLIIQPWPEGKQVLCYKHEFGSDQLWMAMDEDGLGYTLQEQLKDELLSQEPSTLVVDGILCEDTYIINTVLRKNSIELINNVTTSYQLSFLDMLRETNHVKKSKYVRTDSAEALQCAFTQLREDGHKQVIIKHANSRYIPNAENTGWLLFSLDSDVLSLKRCLNTFNSIEDLNNFIRGDMR